MTPTSEDSGTAAAPAASERVNVVLSRNVLDILDHISADLEQQTGARVNRSEIIRAFVGSFGANHLRFRGCRNEADLRTVLDRYNGLIARFVAKEEAAKRR